MVFIRSLFTAGGIALGYVAYLLTECAAVGLPWPSAGVPWTCVAAGTPNSYPGTLAAAVVAGVAAMLIAAAWIPFFIRRRRARINADLSLGENLHRVGEVRSEQVDSISTPAVEEPASEPEEQHEPAAVATPLDNLQAKVETIENDVSSGSMSVGQVTTRWIQLLREANELHNSGEIPTPTFKRVNTRLLELPSLVERQRAKTPVG